MKIVKYTHYRNSEEDETDRYIWFEGNDEKELMVKLGRVVQLLLSFEGLQCIGKCPEEHYAVFAEGLSKDAYWVKVCIEP